MLIPTDTDFATAVDAADRSPRARLLLDWGRDGTYSHSLSDLSTVVDEITVERSLTGDLPNEASMVEGYASSRLTAHLSGQREQDPRDIARLLSPFRPDSPLAGQPTVSVPVRCDLGFLTGAGLRLLRQFTGTTRRLDLTASTRTVEIEALDAAERLRVAITLPLYAEVVDRYYNRTKRPYQTYTNTQWVLDYVLRRNGIYASPPPRPGCIWGVTGHGSLAPDVGHNATISPGRNTTNGPSFIPGKYLLAINGTPQVGTTASYVTAGFPFDITVPHLIEFHILAGDTNTFPNNATTGRPVAVMTDLVGFSGAAVEMFIATNGQLTARISSGATVTGTLTGPKITGQAAWHSVGLWLAHNRTTNTLSFRWQLDGAQTALQTATHTITDFKTPLPRTSCLLATVLPLQCVQLSRADATPPANWGADHAPQADIDLGLNWIVGLPDVVNADSWEVIKQAAAAEYGIVGFTEDGRFVFRNRNTARAQQATTPGRTLSATVSLSELRVSTTMDSVRTDVAATTTPRLQALIPPIVWQAHTSDEFNVAANSTLQRVVRMARRAKIPSGDLTSYSPNDWHDDFPTWGYSAANGNDASYVTTGVTVTIIQFDDEAELNITIRNTNTFPISLAVGTKPALRMQADDITDDTKQASISTNPTAAQKWGRRVLPLPDNPFRQLPDSVSTVATSLLTDLANPAPVIAEIPVTGDPRTQLADLVTITDPDGLGGPIKGSVIGIRRTLSADNGLADFLTVRASTGT